MLCITWLITSYWCIIKEQSLFDLETVCKLEGLILYTFLGSSVFTLLAIAAFHYKTVVLEKSLSSGRTVAIYIAIIWILAIIGSLFGNGIFTGHGFQPQASGLYCLNDFTETLAIERVFNSGIVLILTITPLCFIFIYYRIWKKLELHRHQLFVKRYQGNSGSNERLNVNKMIIRRAIAISGAFAAVFYFDAALFSYQIVTGTRVPWIFDAVGACLGVMITVVNPLLFFSLDVRARKAILHMFMKGENERHVELYNVSVDSVETLPK